MSRVNATYAARTVGCVFVVAHTHGDAQGTINAIERGLAELVKTHPDQVGVALVLHEGATPPDTMTRKKLIAAMRHHRNAIAAFAVVVLGTGFWAAAARSVLTFLSMTSGMPVKVFRDEATAQAWLVEHVKGTPTLDTALAEALADLADARPRPR